MPRFDQTNHRGRRPFTLRSGQRDRAFILDVRAYPVADRQLEVGGRELELAAVGGEQDVAQHGEGALCGNDPSDDV